MQTKTNIGPIHGIGGRPPLRAMFRISDVAAMARMATHRSHSQLPRYRRPRLRGTQAIEVRTRTLELAVDAAELPLALRVGVDGFFELLLAEVGPQDGRGVVLAVGRLPDEEVAQAHLARRPDHQVGIGQLRGVEIAAEQLLGHVVRVDPVAQHALYGVQNLGPSAVVEGHVQLEPVVVGALVDDLHDLGPERAGDALQPPYDMQLDVVLEDGALLFTNGLAEDAHQRLDFPVRPGPVLGGEGVEGEHADAELVGLLGDAPDVTGAGLMAGRSGQPLALRPAAVAVHDDAHVTWDCLGENSPHHTSIISASLACPMSSICLIYESVSFCRRSWARLSSSAESVFSFSMAFRWSMASRRTLRTATRPSSTCLRTSFTMSRRRSSVMVGMVRRMCWPSLLGVSPRSDLRIAFSMLAMAPRS